MTTKNQKNQQNKILQEYLKEYGNQHEARQEDEDNQDYHDRIKEEIQENF